MTAISKAEDPFVQLESHIDMRAIFGPVGTLQQFFGICKPKQLAIEPKMHRQKPAIQHQKHILAFATDSANASALAKAGNARCRLRLSGYRVEDMSAADSPPLHQGTERADDGFHFRQFRHKRDARSRTRLESERVYARFRLSGIAERRENGLAFIPIRKLIRVVAAAR